MSESLKHQATNSVFWSAVERFSVQGIQFLLSIIIARLVLPSDYGLIAMLGVLWHWHKRLLIVDFLMLLYKSKIEQ